MVFQPASRIASRLQDIVGAEHLRSDQASLDVYGVDALGKGHAPDIVVIPANTSQVSAIARLCNEHAVPLVVRGAGTGFTGGAVPTFGGVLLSMERFSRILGIDELNLLAVVEPNAMPTAFSPFRSPSEWTRRHLGNASRFPRSEARSRLPCRAVRIG